MTNLPKIKSIKSERLNFEIKSDYIQLTEIDNYGNVDTFDKKEVFYDYSGNIIESKNTFGDSLRKSESYSYDSLGKIQNYRIYDKGEKFIFHNIYNFDNQLVSKKKFDEYGNLKSSTEYFYNSENQIIKSSSENDEYKYCETYNYNEIDKELIEYISTCESIEHNIIVQYEKIIYTKDKGLNIQKKYFTDYRNDLSLVEIKKNDLNGNLIELVDIEHHLIYKYDYENNLLVSESICSSFEFDFINETYKNMRDFNIETYIYDDYSNVIETRIFDVNNMKFSKQINKFSYDKYGNWIEKNTFFKSKTGIVEKRTIDYFEQI